MSVNQYENTSESDITKDIIDTKISETSKSDITKDIIDTKTSKTSKSDIKKDIIDTKILETSKSDIKKDIIDTKTLEIEKTSIFIFYSKSADKEPGKGSGEILCNGNDFSELKKIKNWRKVLSNFHYEPFEWRNKEWSCIEEAFQATKFGSENYDLFQEALRKKSENLEEDAGIMSQKLRKWKILTEDQLIDWNINSRIIMKEIAEAKYKSSTIGKQVLLYTKNAKLLHYLPRNPRKYEHFKHLEEIRSTLYQ